MNNNRDVLMEVNPNGNDHNIEIIPSALSSPCGSEYDNNET